jgi:uncharacterized protein (DUF924 family)
MLLGMTSQASPTEIVSFWREAGPGKWYRKDAAFDAVLRARFEQVHFAAARREHDDWAGTAEGSLALILLFDQFSRNFWRGSAHAYATDPLARLFAHRAIEAGQDRQIEGEIRGFFYSPLHHSEDLAEQERGVALVQAWAEQGGDANLLRWMRSHRDIVARFGRFPHRNRALGRPTSAEEQAFLDQGGFGG